MTEPKLVGYCVIPEGYGYYNSLYGDGEYLYLGTIVDSNNWRLYKIRISDMQIVKTYTGTGDFRYNLFVIVIGDYIYVGTEKNPRILKFNKHTLEYIATLNLPSPPAYHCAFLFKDPYDENVLWVGSQGKRGPYEEGIPIILKVDLSTFTVAEYYVYNELSNCYGPPCITVGENYLYVDDYNGGRYRVNKSDLSDWSNFVNAPYDICPARYSFVSNGYEYIVYTAFKLSKINLEERTEVYNYDLYEYWIIGLVHFDSEPDYFYVIDMDTPQDIFKIKDTGTGFEEVYRWSIPDERSSAIYGCWFYETPEGERYIIIADWTDGPNDILFKVRVSPPFLSSMYDVKVKLMELISEASEELQPREKHVLGNWRLNYWDLDSDNFPLVTVRITRGRQWEPIYGARAAPYPKHIVFHFTMFIFALNSTPKAKNAQNIADQILDFFTNYNKFEVNSRTKIIDVVGLRYFELEPERGSHRLSRIILEGDLICVFEN